ncbi:MAG: type I restriction enzyme HsdR N-terminal domain-containing protein [Brevinemataceae bacterium]
MQALVNPFIVSLGYDVSNPTECRREFDADPRLKKGDKVDIALIQDEKPIIFIECKKVGENLKNHRGQLNSYSLAIPEVNYGIITDGITYHFYKKCDTQKGHIGEKPFLEFDLTKRLSSSQLNTLWKFHRSEFDHEELSKSIENLETENSIKKFMSSLLTEEISSDSDFINVLIKETPYKSRRGDNKKLFASIASKVIKSWVEDMVKDRINELASKHEEEQENTLSSIQDNSGIITTEEEIQAYHIIKAICMEKITADKINFQDYIGFFSIYFNGKKTKNICKLYLNENKKEIEIFERETIDSLDDLYLLKDKLLKKIEHLQS